MIIYTDGACKFNPGPGAWACIGIVNLEIMKKNCHSIDGIRHFDDLTTDQFIDQCRLVINKFIFHHVNVFLDGSNMIFEIGHFDLDTTNNKMEMTAVINGLMVAKELFFEFDQNYDISLFTDSMYVKDGIEKWIHNWQKNNWKTAAKTPVKNYDLWQKISSYQNSLNIKWHWVKGHSGNQYNDKVDIIARNIVNNYIKL